MDSPSASARRPALVIVAAVLAAGGAAYLWVINMAMVRDADLRRNEELQSELLATRAALRQAEGDFGFLQGAAISLLKSNDRAASARGAVLHRGSTLFLAARQLPAPAKGKAYALWAYLGGKPAAAGVFLPGPDGLLRGRHEMGRDLGAVEGFAITLEDAGGAAAPSGPPILTRP